MSKIILKVEYEQLKFKFAVSDDIITFDNLKSKLLERLESQQIKLESNSVELTDMQNFAYLGTDKVQDYLKQEDTVKVVSVQKPVINDQQQQQQQQLQQKIIPDKDSKIHSQVVEEQKKNEPSNAPIEAIVVLYDTSGSMGQSFYNDKELSRMGAVNALFSAFADKTMGFEYNHIVQLICFNNIIEKKCNFISDFNLFIKLVDSANPGGQTKLFDALQAAVDDLLEIKKTYPNIILRMIALTDGEDNISKEKPSTIARQIIRNKIIVDSFVVGKNCQGLKTITHASGGRCYSPEDINQGLSLFENETILSVEQRGKIEFQQDEYIDLKSFESRPFDTEGIKVAIPQQAQQKAAKLEDIIKKQQQQQQNAAQQNQKSSQKDNFQQNNPNTGSEKRILKEIQDLLGMPYPYIKIFPVEDDIHTWKAFMIGPEKTAYAYGVFQLHVSIPNDYPFKPPKIRFLTSCYHCNINEQGSICLDILKDCWSPALTIQKTLISIHSLLENPNPDDPLNSNVAAEMKHEPERYKENVKKQTILKASIDVDTLLEKIYGTQTDKKSDDYKEKRVELQSWLDKYQAKL